MLNRRQETASRGSGGPSSGAKGWCGACHRGARSTSGDRDPHPLLPCFPEGAPGVGACRRGPSWLGLRVYYLYGNFLANFSCVLALLFFPWRDFLGAFGSITEGGYSEVHPSAGAGREAGGASQDSNSKASPTAHGDGAPRKAVSPPVLSTLLHRPALVCQCVCARVCVHVCPCSSTPRPSLSRPYNLCVCVCVHVCAHSFTPSVGSEWPPQSEGPSADWPCRSQILPPPQPHPPHAAQPGPPRLSGPCGAVAAQGRTGRKARLAPSGDGLPRAISRLGLQGLLPEAGLD